MKKKRWVLEDRYRECAPPLGIRYPLTNPHPLTNLNLTFFYPLFFIHIKNMLLKKKEKK